MKIIYIIVLALLFINCKNDSNQSIDDIQENNQIKSLENDSVKMADTDFETSNKSMSIELKQK